MASDLCLRALAAATPVRLRPAKETCKRAVPGSGRLWPVGKRKTQGFKSLRSKAGRLPGVRGRVERDPPGHGWPQARSCVWSRLQAVHPARFPGKLSGRSRPGPGELRLPACGSPLLSPIVPSRLPAPSCLRRSHPTTRRPPPPLALGPALSTAWWQHPSPCLLPGHLCALHQPGRGGSGGQRASALAPGQDGRGPWAEMKTRSLLLHRETVCS